MKLAEHFLAQHENLARRATESPAWLAALRADALEQFRARGLPTLRDEDWKYTDLRPLEKHRFAAANGEGEGEGEGDAAALVKEAALHSVTPHRLVFVNNRLRADLCKLPDTAGLSVGSLRTAQREHPEALRPHLGQLAAHHRHGFTLLNSAAMDDGVFITVADGAIIDAPLEILFLSAAAASVMVQPRNLIVAGRGSAVTVIERYLSASAGGAATLTNAVTEITAADNAAVHHLRLQQESDAAHHVGGVFADAAADAEVNTTAVILGGAWVRNDVTVRLNAPGARVTMNGLCIGAGRRHMDNHTRVEHAAPHCNSSELYKSVLGGRARSVFHGRILVQPGAVKTDAYQSNRNLLLSPEARADSKPQLEIYADDVRCSHGATTGQLDGDALFYLRARGIGGDRARAMLVMAFAAEVLRGVTGDTMRRYLEDEARAILDRALGGQLQ
ncbi:MAG: Fe-S cluster assembly protein SufD [Gammaproteobacteria bacterium]|nr:Fe-S cluster assembly protein SufD [Gammaproteobacteria bacterium]